MPISISCTCGKKFNVKDDLAGKKIKCPGCQAVLDVPVPSAVASGAAPPQPVMAAVIDDDEPQPAKVARKTARVGDDDDFDEGPRRNESKPRKNSGQKGSKTLLYVLVGGGIVLLGLCCTGVGVGGYLLFQLSRDKKLTVPADESDTWLGATKTMPHRKGTLHYRAYRVDLKAGRTYIIDLKRTGTNNPSTPYLILEDNNGKTLREDEFSGGIGNPRIVFAPATDGEYRILATTGAGLGPFTLSVKEAASGSKEKKDTPDPQDKKDKKDKFFPGKILEDRNRWSPTDQRITIACVFGQVSSPYKKYTVLLRAGKAYTIDLIRHVPDKNPQPDPYLILQNAMGTTLAEDDDGGDGVLDSRLVFVPQQDGEYRIIAASINGFGEYTLTVREK
jgi:hypothetical protein